MIALQRVRNERGIALVVVLLISLIVAVIAAGAALVASNTTLINSYTDRLSVLESAADAGIEEARSRINADKTLYPDSLYNTLESGALVKDNSGATIPGVTRSLYVGPTGISTGEYGVFGSVVSVVRDATGNTVVRRGEVVQESFSKYAYFTDKEGAIVFGGGDQIFGPVHSNDNITINTGAPTPQVIFHNTVESAKNVQNKPYGQFDQGYKENAAVVPMPTTANLTKLKTQALAGNTSFTSTTTGTAGQATMRIEFVAYDLNGDGKIDADNEGFIRVFSNTVDPGYVVADVPADFGANYLRNSKNCGDYAAAGNAPHTAAGTTFRPAWRHLAAGAHTWVSVAQSATRRCLLGGADSLLLNVPGAGGHFTAADSIGGGAWLPYPGVVDPIVTAARGPEAQYLFPINRALNPNFKGVIYVEGKVAVSGKLRGRVTVAATNNIIIADDINYVTNPATGTCADILGLFSGVDIVVADNTLNSPTQAQANPTTRYTFDDTPDEFVQGVLLALNNFTVENYNTGSTADQPCGATAWGRGCLYLTGGIIQTTRGAVGTAAGTGYLKRYSYDACAYTSPPPYFPTTGHFARGRYFEVNPAGFNVLSYYRLLTPH